MSSVPNATSAPALSTPSASVPSPVSGPAVAPTQTRISTSLEEIVDKFVESPAGKVVGSIVFGPVIQGLWETYEFYISAPYTDPNNGITYPKGSQITMLDSIKPTDKFFVDHVHLSKPTVIDNITYVGDVYLRGHDNYQRDPGKRHEPGNLVDHGCLAHDTIIDGKTYAQHTLIGFDRDGDKRTGVHGTLVDGITKYRSQ